MKRAAWAITGALVGLALFSAWFFGLDARHSVILVGTALAGGVANGLLDAVQLPRAPLPAFQETARGLGDLQALEFSLSSADPGTRAVLELHAVATALAARRPGVPRSATLEAFVSREAATTLPQREIGPLLDELERLALDPAGRPRTDTVPQHATFPSTAPQRRQETR